MNNRVLSITGISLLTFVIGCSSGNHEDLMVSEISGPCPGDWICCIPEGCLFINESECVEITIPEHVITKNNQTCRFTVNAFGDTGITYLWSYYPESSGSIDNWTSTSPRAYFHPANPAEITELTIQVEVNSDNYGPIIKQKHIVLNPSTENQEFENLKYHWTILNPEHGYLTDLYSRIPIYAPTKSIMRHSSISSVKFLQVIVYQDIIKIQLLYRI